METAVAIVGGVILLVAGWAFWIRVIAHGDVRPPRKPRQVDLEKDESSSE